MTYTQRLRLLLAMLMALVCATPAAHAAARVTLQKDLVYATVDGVDLLYDFAMPPEGNGPFPFVLCIHAGGWQLGNKKSYRDIVKELAGRGYTAATIEYRLTPKYKWPAQLDDVQRALDLQSSANAYLQARAFGKACEAAQKANWQAWLMTADCP